MAKIVIYEDDAFDLVQRYSRLTSEHEVHVCFKGPPDDIRFLPYDGFARECITSDILAMPSDADVYFSDDLNGACFAILSRLPREKSYLVSGAPDIRERAKEKGFNVIGESEIESIVKKSSS